MFIFFIYQKNFVRYTWILIKIILRNDRVDLLMPTLPQLNLCKLQISILWFRSPHIQIWGFQNNFFMAQMSCDEHLLSSEKISFAQFKFKIQVQEREREVLEKEFLEKTRFFMHFAAFVSLKVYVIKSN